MTPMSVYSPWGPLPLVVDRPIAKPADHPNIIINFKPTAPFLTTTMDQEEDQLHGKVFRKSGREGAQNV